jgi:hypothetical protein
MAEMDRYKRAGKLHSISALRDSGCSTLIIGDSHVAGIPSKDLDPTGKTAVRSVGGMCFPVLAATLAEHKTTYSQFDRIIIAVGCNDLLHGAKCHSDTNAWIKTLEQECVRLFPNAALEFVLPFSGHKSCGKEAVAAIGQTLRRLVSRAVLHETPHMAPSQFSGNSVHLNEEGYAKWLTVLKGILGSADEPKRSQQKPRTHKHQPTSQAAPQVLPTQQLPFSYANAVNKQADSNTQMLQMLQLLQAFLVAQN